MGKTGLFWQIRRGEKVSADSAQWDSKSLPPCPRGLVFGSVWCPWLSLPWTGFLPGSSCVLPVNCPPQALPVVTRAAPTGINSPSLDDTPSAPSCSLPKDKPICWGLFGELMIPHHHSWRYSNNPLMILSEDQTEIIQLQKWEFMTLVGRPFLCLEPTSH